MLLGSCLRRVESMISACLFALLIVDLHKHNNYDSVSRDALWQALKKCGVPLVMLSLIRLCPNDMTAVVRVSDGTLMKLTSEID